jgi:electron transfer flavoprotein beta subunit
MHIAVILRLVPDISEELDIDDSGAALDREWIGIKLNEFDEQAMEEAILLKESVGARVTALALAGEGVQRALQSAIARGADEAVIVDHGVEEPVGDRTAAALISATLPELNVDAVFAGVQTPEDVFGQLGPFLGAMLGWPHVSAISGVRAHDGALRVRQEYSGGVSAEIECRLPMVAAIQTASQPPRYVSGSRLRQAMTEGSVRTVTAADTAVPGPAATMTALHAPEGGARAEMLSGSATAIAERIHTILAERGHLQN